MIGRNFELFRPGQIGKSDLIIRKISVVTRNKKTTTYRAVYICHPDGDEFTITHEAIEKRIRYDRQLCNRCARFKRDMDRFAVRQREQQEREEAQIDLPNPRREPMSKLIWLKAMAKLSKEAA